jgi:hypothetical protein
MEPTLINSDAQIEFYLKRFVNIYQVHDPECDQALIDIVRAEAVRNKRPSNIRAAVTWMLKIDHDADPQRRFFSFLKRSLEYSWANLLCENIPPEPVRYRISSMWGAIYRQGDWADYHTHGPNKTSWVYYLQADQTKGSPLVFDNTGYEIVPATGQLIMFPSWLGHSVPKFEPGDDSERIIIAGNCEVV